MTSTTRIGYALCSASMLTVGAAVPLTRGLLHYPVAAGQALRYGLAALILAAVAARTRPAGPAPTRAEWIRLLALAGLSLVAYNAFLLAALRHGDPAPIAALLGAAPIGLAVGGPDTRRRRPGTRTTAAAALAVAGTLVVIGAGRTDGWGVAYALGALAADLAFTLLAAPLLTTLGPLRVAAHSCALATPMFVIAAIATAETSTWRPPTAREMALIAFLAVVLTACSFLSWFHGVRRIGVEHAGITVSLVPVATLLATCVQDGTLPAPLQAIGVGIVAVGIVLAAAQIRRV